MSFQPVVPFGGNAGWAFLQRTREAQQSAFEARPQLVRDTQAFSARIGQIRSAEALVADRTLLSVALGAFGLEADIDNRFFIGKVLEEGTIDPDALGNRLSDKRYSAMAEAFGFDLAPPRTALSGFADQIVSAYHERQFEAAVGKTAPDMRLALGLKRDLTDLAARTLSDEGMWFTVMATPPLRTVFERALNLPAAIGTLDIDRQLSLFRDRSEALFGTDSPRGFVASDKFDELTRRFLVGSEGGGAFGGPSVRGATALTLLQLNQTYRAL